MPSTPAEWRDDLVRRLDTRWARLQKFDLYYEGDQRLAYVTQRFRDAYGALFSDLTDNYMALVVDTAAERLRVNGFRFDDRAADKDANRIWQANGLDAESNMVHTEAIKLGEAYWLVQPNGEIPKITSEHPSQVIVDCEPGDRKTRRAALKKWVDGETVFANVYLPDRVVKYRQTRKPTIIDQVQDYRTMKWEIVSTDRNPLGVVPIVPIRNNPSMLRGGKSDLAGGPLSLQDAINKELADMLIGSEYTAYRQRVLLGVDQPRDENGKPLPISEIQQQAQQSRLWMFPGKDAKAFEFGATDLSNMRTAIDGLVGDLAAQTRIPIYYFRPTAISNLSAEALIGLDAGLVSKTDDKKDPVGEGHEEMMRLSFLSIDKEDPRAKTVTAETIWKNTENRSEAQRVDAVTKEVSLGLPFEVALEKLGYSPQEIDRILSIKETESLAAEAFGPPVQPEMNGAGVPPVAPTR